MSDLLDPNSEFMNPTSSQADHETILFYPGVPDSWNQEPFLFNSGCNLSVDDYLPDHIILQPCQAARVHVSAHVLTQAEMTSRSKRKVDDETPLQNIELRGRELGRKQSEDMSKSSRSADLHNFCERRRRGRINENIKALGALIPTCNKTDKASILDEAVVYIRALQLQAETLSMSRVAQYMSQSCFQQMPYYSPYLSLRPRPMGIGDAGFQRTCPMFSLLSAAYHPSIGSSKTAIFPQDSGRVAPRHYQSSVPMLPFNYAYKQFGDSSS